jgi:hypothetical protein
MAFLLAFMVSSAAQPTAIASISRAEYRKECAEEEGANPILKSGHSVQCQRRFPGFPLIKMKNAAIAAVSQSDN